MKQLTRYTANFLLEDFLPINGSTKMGVRNGTGVQKFKDGCLFVGKWVDNKPHGHGQVIFPDGSTLTGSFQNGTIRQGRLQHTRGLSFIGEFHTVGFKAEGFKRGLVEFSNGDYFLGEWSDSTVGIIRGTFYGRKDQSVKKFEVESRLVVYDSDCFGKIIERDFIYEGQIKHDYIFGTGVVFKFDGISFEEQNSPVTRAYAAGLPLTLGPKQSKSTKLSIAALDFPAPVNPAERETPPRQGFGGNVDTEHLGSVRINGQNYNMPSGKLHGLQREMIFSHYSDKHVIVEQIYESGKKVLHCNVFSNGLKISFRNESLPKRITFIEPDFVEIAGKVPNLLYKGKVLSLLKLAEKGGRLRGYQMQKEQIVSRGRFLGLEETRKEKPLVKVSKSLLESKFTNQDQQNEEKGKRAKARKQDTDSISKIISGKY